jgi:malate dehydrogenase (oxaloacetate-decarboxylating)
VKKKADVDVQMEIDRANKATGRWNSIAIVSDGSAVPGLGNVGPEAALPVMEGKALIFKSLAGINAYPICLRAGSDDELISAVASMEPTFAGINLEDIAAPRCFHIESRLKEIMNIPIFHDQHGTAIVVLAGLINAFKITMRDYTNVKIAINGAGAAGIAVAKLLHRYGIRDIVVCDKRDAIYDGRIENMNMEKQWIALNTNPSRKRGNIKEVIRDCDVLIGLSTANVLSSDDVHKMAPEAIIFAMSNPEPEILPHLARRGGARIIGTGCSDYPNHIDNALVFPGFFLGLMVAKCAKITDEMKMAAADALAGTIKMPDLKDDAILPDVFDRRVVPSIALSVALAAIKSGATEEKISVSDISKQIDERLSKL